MNRPNLLLLHGALGSKSQFSPLLPLLKEHFQVHTLDFEGHGTSPPKERPFRIGHFVENVLEYQDEHGLGPIKIFGYSLGGAVGVVLADQHPERIDRVHTLATKFVWTAEIAQRESAQLDPDMILQKVPRFADALKERHVALDWIRVLEKTKEMFSILAGEDMLNEEAMARIYTPMRLGVGDRDKMVSIEETAKVYRLIPNCQLQVFPGTPHPLERVPLPDLVHSLLSFFI